LSFQARPLQGPPVFPLEKGLVLWFPFDDRSGATAYDRSGKRNNGVLYGPTWVAGRRGSALSFDGTSAYVNCGKKATLDLTSALTILAWVKAGDFTAERCIVSKSYAAYELKFYSSRFVFECSVGGVDVWAKADGLVPVTGTWYHVAWTYDSTTHKLYIDGVSYTPTFGAGAGTTGPIDANTEDVHIGCRPGPSLFWDSIIEEVRLYNRALSSAEIKRLYESELLLVRH